MIFDILLYTRGAILKSQGGGYAPLNLSGGCEGPTPLNPPLSTIVPLFLQKCYRHAVANGPLLLLLNLSIALLNTKNISMGHSFLMLLGNSELYQFFLSCSIQITNKILTTGICTLNYSIKNAYLSAKNGCLPSANWATATIAYIQ